MKYFIIIIIILLLLLLLLLLRENKSTFHVKQMICMKCHDVVAMKNNLLQNVFGT